jgi:hypothetical protein
MPLHREQPCELSSQSLCLIFCIKYCWKCSSYMVVNTGRDIPQPGPASSKSLDNWRVIASLLNLVTTRNHNGRATWDIEPHETVGSLDVNQNSHMLALNAMTTVLARNDDVVGATTAACIPSVDIRTKGDSPDDLEADHIYALQATLTIIRTTSNPRDDDGRYWDNERPGITAKVINSGRSRWPDIESCCHGEAGVVSIT